MASVTELTATLSGLAEVEGKAELIVGRIVHLMPTGFGPGQVGGRIYQSLDAYARRVGLGVALPDNVGYAVTELNSGRQSFSPDASYFAGVVPTNLMDFVAGPPTLAVEVRRKHDYGTAAEMSMHAKRADYFEAGTLVVWDVDLVARVIRSYTIADPEHPVLYASTDLAASEPAVPG